MSVAVPSTPALGGDRDDGVAQAAVVDQAGERRAVSIEALRAVAALAVLLCHLFILTRGIHGPSYGHRLVLGLGVMGVYLFFVLTGFLLYRPFARAAFAAGPAIDLKGYAVNRALRILPLYYAVLAIVVLVDRVPGDQALRFALFTQNFNEADVAKTVDPPIWSLVLEVQFYILLPLIAGGLAWLSRGRPGRVAAILIATGIASAWASTLDVATHDVWFHSFPAMWRLFAAGMLLALVRVWLDQRPADWQPPRLARGDLLVLAGAGAWALIALDERVRWESASALGCMAIVAAAVLPLRASPLDRLLAWRPLALVGIASYSIYLWHYPVLWWIGVDEAGFDGLSGFLKGCVIAVPVVLAIAFVSYRVLEAPALRWRRPWFRVEVDDPRRAGEAGRQTASPRRPRGG